MSALTEETRWILDRTLFCSFGDIDDGLGDILGQTEGWLRVEVTIPRAERKGGEKKKSRSNRNSDRIINAISKISIHRCPLSE